MACIFIRGLYAQALSEAIAPRGRFVVLVGPDTQRCRLLGGPPGAFLEQCGNRWKLGHAENHCFHHLRRTSGQCPKDRDGEVGSAQGDKGRNGPNHLSIIELAELVTEVAAGSSSYKIEWRGNKVFVQPLDPEATTNLFSRTASGRMNYELVPAQSVQEMHFAIDQEPGPTVGKVTISARPAEDPRVAQEAKLAAEMLFASTPVRLAGEAKNSARVEVILKDIYRKDDRIYVRYVIQNNGRSTYVPGTPGVFTLRSPRSSISLYALSQSQLVGDGLRVTSEGQAPVKVLNAEVHANAVAPGGTTWGMVALEWPPMTDRKST